MEFVILAVITFVFGSYVLRRVPRDINTDEVIYEES